MTNTTPVEGRTFAANDFVGQTLALIGKELRPNITTQYGPKDAYKADIVVLSGPREGTFFEDVLLFQKELVKVLFEAEIADQPVIGVLQRVPTGHSSGSTKFAMMEPTTTDLRLAAHFGV